MLLPALVPGLPLAFACRGRPPQGVLVTMSVSSGKSMCQARLKRPVAAVYRFMVDDPAATPAQAAKADHQLKAVLCILRCRPSS